jgi:hypothetical protein
MQEAKKKGNLESQLNFMRSVQADQDDKDAVVYKRYRELDSDLASWNDLTNRWEGSAVNKINNKIVASEKRIRNNI